MIRAPVSEDLRLRAQMLAAALRALDEAGIRWCAVSGGALEAGGADGPAGNGGGAGDDVLRAALVQCRLDPDDIDLVVSPRQAAQVPRVLAGLPGMHLVREYRYAATAVRYDLACLPPGGPPAFVALDVSSEVRGFHTVLMRADEFLAGRRRAGPLLWTAEPCVQFVFAFLKQLQKMEGAPGGAGQDRAARLAHLARLAGLYRADPAGCRRQLRRFFSAATAARIARAAEQRRWDWVLASPGMLAGELARLRARADRLGALRYRAGEWTRRLRRIARPAGMMVVFLGLDGSGKSTVIDRLLEELSPVFAGGRCYHQRPCFLWRGAEDRTVRGPRPMPRRRWFASLLKLGVWAADYWAGFVCDIFPRLVQSGLVLFDRYYYDLIVDPDRYRYGGPRAAARMLARLLPRPDLVILLDAPPDVADARRRDGEFRSAARLRPAYTALVRGLRNGRIVDASRPVRAVVGDAERAILEGLGRRMRRRLGAPA